MSELLLINPRRAKRRKSRKGKMPAGLRRYWAAKRRGSAAPKRRRRRHAARAGAVVRRRRRRAVVGTVRRRRANPRHRSSRRFVMSRRRRRHNPRMLGGLSVNGVLHGTVLPAATGAVGGLALDIIFGKLSPMLPATLQTGIPAFVAKAGAAVGLGMLAGRFVGRDRAKVATIGAVTVLFYGMMKTQLMKSVPSLGLSGFQDFVTYSGQPSMGAYMGPRPMGAYMPRLGTLNPAPFISAGSVPGSNMGGMGGGSYNWADDGM